MKIFGNHLEIRVVVFDSNEKDGLVYSGNASFKSKTIYLYLKDNHFDSIININGFLGSRYFCENCLKTYAHKPHKCIAQCEYCFSKDCSDSGELMLS